MRNVYIPEKELAEIVKRLEGVDRVITLLLLGTGFRLDDIMHLRVWQLRAPELTIRERKTGNVRSVTIPAGVSEVCKAYAARRMALCYAFPALRRYGARKMHRTTYWRHFMEVVRRLGWEDKGYSPHSLRKVYAVNALSRSGSLRAVQKDLGHASMGVTALYALSDRYGDL